MSEKNGDDKKLSESARIAKRNAPAEKFMGYFMLIGFITLGALFVWKGIFDTEIPNQTQQKTKTIVQKTQQLKPAKQILVADLHKKLGISTDGTKRWYVLLETYNKDKVRLKLIYKYPPKYIATIAKDTMHVAKAALSVLTAHGWSFFDDDIQLSVWARFYSKGVTGHQVTISYGRTYYDSTTDSLIWKKAKKGRLL